MPESKKLLMLKVKCSICGAGFEREEPQYPEHIDRETLCSLNCYRAKLNEKEIARYNQEVLGIPLKYRDIKCDSGLLKENFSKNLFITGKSGVGKTVLAAGIAKECIKNKIYFKWLNYTTFVMELQAMFGKEAQPPYVKRDPFEEAKRIAIDSAVLIIDDLGANKATEWVRQITYYIINEREQRMLPTIITSNFTLEEIAEQIDVRISSRIIGLCKTIKLSGKDRRLDDKNKDWAILGGSK